MHDDSNGRDVAVLASGGIESAVLCVYLLREFARVFPLYVRFGLRWEGVEEDRLRGFLARAARPGLMPIQILDEPVGDLYGATHWSTRGHSVPGADTADEAVYLPGRNLLLGSKAAVWCGLRGVDRLAFGCLQSNPFADSSPEFFAGFEHVVNRALGTNLRTIRPFAHMHKTQVIHQGIALDLPLGQTFSCIQPVDNLHCGSCNKCAERRAAFEGAGVPDPTAYARPAQTSRD